MSAAAPEQILAIPAPRVAVVMTVYRDVRFLKEAVDSILTQDFSDFEFIIVDDGNTMPALFEELARRDSRIRIVTNPVNIGTAAAANRGIEHARADIILRLDCDDVAEPGHISRLVAELDDDPQLGLVGSTVHFIDETGQHLRIYAMPQTDTEIRWTILFHNPFIHSSVAFRRQLFDAAGRYIPSELVSQDHYLWFSLLPLCRMRNLPEPLTRYRLNSHGLIATNMKGSRGRTHRIRETLWPRIGLRYDLYDDAAATDISEFMRGNVIVAPERRAKAYTTMLTVLRAFLVAPQPFRRPEDTKDAKQLARTIIARMWRDPPPERRDMFRLFQLCSAIDMRTALIAVRGRAALSLRTRWRTALKHLPQAQSNL